MVELPEAHVMAKQLSELIVGRTIVEAEANRSPHGFAFYSRPPEMYGALLEGQVIASVNAGTGYTCGGNVEIVCGDRLLAVNAPIRYHADGVKLPSKHQLRLRLDDGASLTCTVQMYGGLLVVEKDSPELPSYMNLSKCPSPYDEGFDYDYFLGLDEGKGNLSAKAFLATEQRIPGLGNGVLQDILWNCFVHPRRRLDTLSDENMRALFESLKATMFAMREQGGRDTDKDVFGQPGRYVTKLSNKTKGQPCQRCGGPIVREAFLGGNIYFCPTCQPFEKRK